MGNNADRKITSQDSPSLLGWAQSFIDEVQVAEKSSARAEPAFSISTPWRVIGSGALRTFSAGKLFFSDAKKIFSKESTSDILRQAEEDLEAAHALAEAGDTDSAAKRYREILTHLEGATFFGNYDPKILKMHALKAQSYHGLGDYQAAEGEFHLAKLLDRGTAHRQLSVYHEGLRRMAQEFEAQVARGQEASDLILQHSAAREAIKIYEVLGESEKAQAMADGMEGSQGEARFEELKVAAQEAAKRGLLTQAGIKRFEQANPEIRLSKFFFLSEDSALGFSEEFQDIPQDRKNFFLEQLQMVSADGRLRQVAQDKSHPAHHYFQSEIDLMEGRLEAAKLGRMDFIAGSEGSEDPEIQELRKQAKQELKAWTLAHLEQVRGFNEELAVQRSGHMIDKEDGGFVDRDAIRKTSEQNQFLLNGLKTQLEAGEAVTLDEALAGIQAENPKLWDYYLGLHQSDPDFSTLLKREMRKALENRQDPEAKRLALFREANRLRHPKGSYSIASQMLEAVLAEEMETARAELPTEVGAAIRREGHNGFVEYKIREGLKEQRQKMAEEKPLEYRLKYGESGPTKQDLQAEFEAAQDQYIEKRMRGEIFKIIEHRHAQGSIEDSLSVQAWSSYEDLNDPVNKWGTVSDASRDAIIDEAVVTVATLPLTMGVGAALRGGLAGSRLAVQIAARSQAAHRLVRAGTFVLGSGAEALTQELLTMPFAGSFEMQRVGYNFAMSAAFHGGGALGRAYGRDLGVGLESQILSRQAAQRAFQRGAVFEGVQQRLILVGKQAADFSVQTGTQTILGTASTLLEERIHGVDSQADILDRLGSSLLRMLGSHAATRGINVASRGAFTRYESSGFEKLRGGIETFAQDVPAQKLEKIVRLQTAISEQLGLRIRYGSDGKPVVDAGLRLVARLTKAPVGTAQALAVAQAKNKQFIPSLMKLLEAGDYHRASAFLRKQGIRFWISPKGEFVTPPSSRRYSEVPGQAPKKVEDFTVAARRAVEGLGRGISKPLSLASTSVPEIASRLDPLPNLPRVGASAGIISGGDFFEGFSRVVPKDGKAVLIKDLFQIRYNGRLEGYEFRKAGIESEPWKRIEAGESLRVRGLPFVFLEVHGVPKDAKKFPAIPDVYQQALHGLAKDGVKRHLQSLERQGTSVDTIDAHNLSLFFGNEFESALTGHDAGEPIRRQGGILGGSSEVFAFVDPKSGKIHGFAQRLPKKEEGRRRPLWVLEKDAEIGTLRWIDREHPQFTEALDSNGIPSDAILVAFSLDRMTGRISTKSQHPKMKNLRNLFAQVGGATSTALIRYASGEGRDAVLAPTVEPLAPTFSEKAGIESLSQDGETVIKGKSELTINGEKSPAGKWAAMAFGDTLKVGDSVYAYRFGEWHEVGLAPDEALPLGHGAHGVVLDHGDGFMTKVARNFIARDARGKSLGHPLDNEQAALAEIAQRGIADFTPVLQGRLSKNELVLTKLPGKDLSKLSAEAWSAIPESAWAEFESNLRLLNDSGIAHKDLNAGNILWDGKKLRLIDFGMANIALKSADDVEMLNKLRENPPLARDEAADTQVFPRSRVESKRSKTEVLSAEELRALNPREEDLEQNGESGTVVEEFATPTVAQKKGAASLTHDSHTAAQQGVTVGEIMDYLDPHLAERARTLEALSAEAHPMREHALRFAEGLRQFRDMNERFQIREASLRQGSLELKNAIKAHGKKLLEAAKKLRVLPYHQMYRAFENRVRRIEKDLQWVDQVLSVFTVQSQRMANRRNEEFGRIKSELQSASLQDLPARHFVKFVNSGDFSSVEAASLVVFGVQGVTPRDVKKIVAELRSSSERLVREGKPGRFYMDKDSGKYWELSADRRRLTVALRVHGHEETHAVRIEFYLDRAIPLKMNAAVAEAPNRQRIEAQP